jgi:Na+/melibiose symporter-like transporter
MLKEPTKRDYFYLTIYYLSPSFFWALMLLVVIQMRIENLLPGRPFQRPMDIIVNAGGLVCIITQVVIGAISDRHRGAYGRRRPYIVAGTLLAIPAIWFFVLAGNFLMLVVAFMLVELLLNIANGPYQALIPDMVPPERHGIASGYMGLWNLVGQFGGLALGALLFSGAFGKNGMIYLFGIFSVLSVVLMVLTVTHVREEPYTGERVQKRRAVLGILKTDLRSHPAFVWVLVSRFLINLGFYVALLYLKKYLQFVLGFPENTATVYALVLGVVLTITGLIGTVPAGRLADRVSKKTIIYGTCALCTVSAFLFCAAAGISWAIAAAAVFGLGLGAFAAVDWALACNVLPEGDAAKFLGIWTISFVFPQMAAALVADLTITAFTGTLGVAGAYRAVFASIVPFMVLGTIAVSRIKERPVKLTA